MCDDRMALIRTLVSTTSRSALIGQQFGQRFGGQSAIRGLLAHRLSRTCQSIPGNPSQTLILHFGQKNADCPPPASNADRAALDGFQQLPELILGGA